MKFVYVLAVTLFLFEGFITQCAGAGGSEKPSTSAKQQPDHMAHEKKFKDSLISLYPRNLYDSKTEELSENYIQIYGYDEILSTFNEYGHVINRVRISYEALGKAVKSIRPKLNENIIKKYSGNWTELQLDDPDFLGFIDEVSNGEPRISFPNVKKFEYSSYEREVANFGGSYDLNVIFPKLESLTLHFNVLTEQNSKMEINPTCLENVTKLKELQLEIAPDSLGVAAFEKILSKNKGITELGFTITDNIDYLSSIMKNLKNLQTLKIEIDGTQFLSQISAETSFKIPTLKRLSVKWLGVSGREDELRTIGFINRFKSVEIVDMIGSCDVIISELGSLTHAKEFITKFVRIDQLGGMLEKFERKKSSLKRLKLLRLHISKYDEYKNEMNKINQALQTDGKPTWQPSFVKLNTSNFGEFVLTRNK